MGFFLFPFVFAILINVLVMENSGEVITARFQFFDTGGMRFVLRLENSAKFTVTESCGIAHFIYLLVF